MTAEQVKNQKLSSENTILREKVRNLKEALAEKEKEIAKLQKKIKKPAAKKSPAKKEVTFAAPVKKKAGRPAKKK